MQYRIRTDLEAECRDDALVVVQHKRASVLFASLLSSSIYQRHPERDIYARAVFYWHSLGHRHMAKPPTHSLERLCC